MRALVWDGSRARLVTDRPEPEPRVGRALVRVLHAGICSTDLQILAGYMAFQGILGHEFVGEVVIGPPHLCNRRVVGEINFGCGRCHECAGGSGKRHCPNRTVLGILGADGAFADLVELPLENLHVVPDEISDLEAVFVEPLAAALRAEEQSRDFGGSRTAVVGGGKLGLLIAQVLRARGDDVTVVCRGERSQGLAEGFGLRVGTSADPPRGCDLVVDATGSRDGLALAIGATRPLGAVLLKSTVAGRHDIELAKLVIDEITVLGSRCGDFVPALAALAERRVAVAPLIDAVLPLEDGEAALERAAQPGALKILLTAQG